MKRTRRLFTLTLSCALLLTLVVSWGASASAPTDGPWVNGSLLPAQMVRYDSEVSGGKMYVLGFRLPTGETDGSVWVYDPVADSWGDTGVDMPVPVSNYHIAKLTDSNGVGLYIFGGRDSAGLCTDTVQVFYPGTNTTATVATDPWNGQVNPGERVFPGAVEVVGNKAYAWGGFCGGTTAPFTGSETWIFDPMAAGGARWTAGPTLPMNGAYQTGAVLDGKVYSIGGDTFDGTSLFPYADVLMLDSANLGAGWQAKASLPLPSSGSPGCDESRAFGFDSSSGWALAGKVVLAGCGQWNATNTALPDSFLYDAAGNSWTTFAALIQARRNHAGAFIVAPDGLSGKMWVGGGYIPGAVNTGTDTTETYTISFSAPTAVGLDDFSARGSDMTLALVGGGLLLGLALAMLKRRPVAPRA